MMEKTNRVGYPAAAQRRSKMKKKFALAALMLFACLFALPIPAFADTGPKPSVVITFQNLKQKNCYVTLLTRESDVGGDCVYDPAAGNKDVGDAPEVWQKFVDYKDTDGFYFLQSYRKLDADGTFQGGYYPPPKEFKILMYFPDDNSFAVSPESYQSYAFSSYYTVDASALSKTPVPNGAAIHARKSYDYTGEALSLLVRTIITIAIELLIALPFGYLAKQQLGFIALVNVATQLVLNILLNLVNYNQGGLIYLFLYVFLELFVFAAEAVIYAHSATLRKYAKPERKLHPVLYALIANLASYIAGIFLFLHIPWTL